MIRAATFNAQTVAVFGLGLSGRASVASLAAGGAQVAAWDDGDAGREAAKAAGIALTDLHDADWSRFSALVLAPGVPLTHPVPHWTVRAAQSAGVPIIGDTEIFCRERQRFMRDNLSASPLIAITGTNGKSTTTALIAHVLRDAGLDVQMGGNIGVPILALSELAPERAYVVEFSSYQIDLTPSLHPTAGVLLNISPDHLDRHGTLARYAAIKARLIEGADHAIVGCDDALSRTAGQTLPDGKRVTMISGTPADQGADGSDADGANDSAYGILTTRANADAVIAQADGPVRHHAGHGAPVTLASIASIPTLRGAHNAQNAAAAGAVARAMGLSPARIQAGFTGFAGLPHRMEDLGEVDGVLCINDSKATNADSAARALSALKNVYWIAGGLAKDGGIADLLAYRSRIRHAFLIGDAATSFAATLDGQVPYTLSGTLDQAVPAALAQIASDRENDRACGADASTPAPPVLLLAPACASFDQYRSFEVRGDAFRALLAGLPGFVARAQRAATTPPAQDPER
ncbi:MAG: UDP-N-acetylmuramoyl-L-alanine--D-glutamate ligase [Pseudomonadota bacterium]